MKSILTSLKTYQIWNEVLDLSKHLQGFPKLLDIIASQKTLESLAKKYFDSNESKAIDFLNNVY